MTSVKKETIDYRRENGLCIECGEESRLNLTTCESCFERRKQRRKERREKDPEKYKRMQSENMSRHRKKYLELNICWRCGKNELSTGLLCTTCSDKKNKNQKALKENRLNQGLCKYCGKTKVTNPKSKSCHECFFKNMATQYLKSRDRWKELEEIFLKQNSMCPYTGIQLIAGVNASMDHIVARSTGGIECVSNLQWVYHGDDFDVNMMKRDFSESNFLKAIKVIYEHKYHENIHTMVDGKRS